ncbi:hypothetical protein CALCODRAFT_510285 [Calocera cornea HHB12733]|uniref:Uncharacterized protein n=1 Tax=Calocera cornea HHB12733 TaxID=1353952 RepID=A0A165EM35_9BASI|nr:hypothetical protein CALCODRAFT_510285 [Calocera cornea HHB12733]
MRFPEYCADYDIRRLSVRRLNVISNPEPVIGAPVPLRSEDSYRLSDTCVLRPNDYPSNNHEEGRRFDYRTIGDLSLASHKISKRGRCFNRLLGEKKDAVQIVMHDKRVYLVWGATVSGERVRSNWVKTSHLHLMMDCGRIPQIFFSFTPIEGIRNMKRGELVDQSRTWIQLRAFNEFANKFCARRGKVVAVKGLATDWSTGLCLRTGAETTVVYFDDNDIEQQELQTWYEEHAEEAYSWEIVGMK